MLRAFARASSAVLPTATNSVPRYAPHNVFPFRLICSPYGTLLALILRTAVGAYLSGPRGLTLEPCESSNRSPSEMWTGIASFRQTRRILRPGACCMDARMSGSKTLTCWICGKPVPIETCKFDERGKPVHEDCAVVKTRFDTGTRKPTHGTHKMSRGLVPKVVPRTRKRFVSERILRADTRHFRSLGRTLGRRIFALNPFCFCVFGYRPLIAKHRVYLELVFESSSPKRSFETVMPMCPPEKSSENRLLVHQRFLLCSCVSLAINAKHGR
jgi:hypothetical protein